MLGGMRGWHRLLVERGKGMGNGHDLRGLAFQQGRHPEHYSTKISWALLQEMATMPLR